ncbi:AraC family transcriptional regulator [Comamonas flocculans]|uniref:Helix-turn-helix transcriptional regulator n=1 Tax=Comamonas flocculans TaxID=2597701 RepID=A0A5B8RZV6_9BURK|nr:helix-turn-helix transcriptional regulator [Comamonas flocculans]QEA14364.1 helix-turn-helix transcriptional regulator [Comamonas flocculans]
MSLPLLSPDLASAANGPPVLGVVARSGEVRATPRHRHARGQLFGATQGLLSVDAGNSRWVVPATHAVWIPPGVAHGLKSHGPFSGWSLYVATSACGPLPGEPCVLSVSGLLREALARAVSWPQGAALDAAQLRLAAVILDEIGTRPRAELGLSMPRDARLLRIAQALSEHPDDGRSLDHWARWAGIAPRTLSRRFVAETGFSFSGWRQRVRLLRALQWLAAGRSVTATALDLGYDNVSAFIALFRRVFGVTPARYAHALSAQM